MIWLKKILIKFFMWLQKAAQRSIYESYRTQYTISPKFRFNGPNIQLYGEGKICLGANSYVGSYSTLQADPQSKIEIGENCRISHNVRIYTSTNEVDQDFNEDKIKKHFGDVVIGDGVWIGVNVYISPGVTIGNNSVVGANSVVTTDISPNSIYGGVPAKLVRMKR